MLSNFINKVKFLYQRRFWDIALFLLILLAVTGILGLWRLRQITPQKAPITFESL